MLGFLSANLGTILITLVLVAVVTAVVLMLRRDRKKGKSTCGGNCGHCPMCASCHHDR